MNAPLLFLIGAAVTLLALAPAGKFLPTQPNFTGKQIPTAAGAVLLPIILLTLFSGTGGDFFVFSSYLLLAVVVGFVDDVWGDGGARGFRGHVGALLARRLTTGLVKILAFGGGALLVGVWVFGVGVSALVGAFLLAGWANLGNLFDVRPGRAIKFTLLPALVVLFAAPGWAASALSGLVGGICALFYFDVRGRIMLGDAGAAACGSAVGLLVLSVGPGAVWIVAGLLVVSLTLVAEFSSISRLIQEVGVLRWLDLWGRVRGE